VVCVQQGGLTRFGHRESRFALSCSLLFSFSFRILCDFWCVLSLFLYIEDNVHLKYGGVNLWFGLNLRCL
jgi:hypothetical protein